MRKFFSKRSIFSSFVSIVLSVAFVASVAFAASTISTNIQTDGTLAVTGASTFTGVGTFNGQLQASSTALFGGNVTVYNATVGLGHATTTALGNFTADGIIIDNGQLQASSTALFGGAVTTYGSDTLGAAAGTGTLTINDGTIAYGNVATSTIVAANLNAWTIATSSAVIPFLKFNTSNYRIGIGTSTPGATFSVAGDGLYTGNLTVSGTFSPTQTTATSFTVTNLTLLNGQLQASSTALFGGAVTVYNATLGLGNATTTAAGNISTAGTLTVTGLTTLNGQLQASSTALFGGAVTVYNSVLGLGNATTSAAGNFGTMGFIGAGTTSPTTLELSADGSATTTISAVSSVATKGGCIQLKNASSTALYRMYLNTGGGTATTTTNGVGYIAVWEPGSCK